MMDEALDVIMRLMTDPTPLTYESDWFKLREAVLQLRPYTQPHPPLAVASMESPVRAARGRAARRGRSSRSPLIGGLRGQVDLKKMWAIAEEEAAKHGKTMRREEWRLVVPVHLAESREEAIANVREGGAAQSYEYGGAALGRQPDVRRPARGVRRAHGETRATGSSARRTTWSRRSTASTR